MTIDQTRQDREASPPLPRMAENTFAEDEAYESRRAEEERDAFDFDEDDDDEAHCLCGCQWGEGAIWRDHGPGSM